MPRHPYSAKHTAQPDPRYNNVRVGKFINCLMHNGKKSLAQRVLYDAFEYIRETTKKEPIDVFDAAMGKVMPVVEVKSRRVGGATYQVPMEVRAERRATLARRWIIRSSRLRHGKDIAHKLAAELVDAANGTGASVKKREDTHKMAEANKAFSHFRY